MLFSPILGCVQITGKYKFCSCLAISSGSELDISSVLSPPSYNILLLKFRLQVSIFKEENVI